VHFFIKIPSNNKKVPFILIFTRFILLVLIAGSNSPTFDPIKNRFEHGIVNVAAEFQEEKRKLSSAGLRFDMWEASLVTIYDLPLTGIGAGNHAKYFSILDQEKRTNVNTDIIIKFNHLHNDIIQAWVSMGVIFGSLFLLYILYLTIFFANQIKHKESAIAGLFVCIAFILCGLTDVPAHSAVSLTLFLLITALNISFLNSQQPKDSLKTSHVT
jgi:O-antigen ligase